MLTYITILRLRGLTKAVQIHVIIRWNIPFTKRPYLTSMMRISLLFKKKHNFRQTNPITELCLRPTQIYYASLERTVCCASTWSSISFQVLCLCQVMGTHWCMCVHPRGATQIYRCTHAWTKKHVKGGPFFSTTRKTRFVFMGLKMLFFKKNGSFLKFWGCFCQSWLTCLEPKSV